MRLNNMRRGGLGAKSKVIDPIRKTLEDTIRVVGLQTPMFLQESQLASLTLGVDNLVKRGLIATYSYLAILVAHAKEEQSTLYLKIIMQELLAQFVALEEGLMHDYELAEQLLNNNLDYTEEQHLLVEQQLLEMQKQLEASVKFYQRQCDEIIAGIRNTSQNYVMQHSNFQKLNTSDQALVKNYIRQPRSLEEMRKYIPKSISQQHAMNTAQTNIELVTAGAMALTSSLSKVPPLDAAVEKKRLAELLEQQEVLRNRIEALKKELKVLKYNGASPDASTNAMTLLKPKLDQAEQQLKEFKKAHHHEITAYSARADQNAGVSTGLSPTATLKLIKRLKRDQSLQKSLNDHVQKNQQNTTEFLKAVQPVSDALANVNALPKRNHTRV